MNVKFPARWVWSYVGSAVLILTLIVAVAKYGFRGGQQTSGDPLAWPQAPDLLWVVVYEDRTYVNGKLVAKADLLRTAESLYRAGFPIDGPVRIRANVHKEQWDRVMDVTDALERLGYRNIKIDDPAIGGISGWRGSHELRKKQ